MCSACDVPLPPSPLFFRALLPHFLLHRRIDLFCSFQQTCEHRAPSGRSHGGWTMAARTMKPSCGAFKQRVNLSRHCTMRHHPQRDFRRSGLPRCLAAHRNKTENGVRCFGFVPAPLRRPQSWQGPHEAAPRFSCGVQYTLDELGADTECIQVNRTRLLCFCFFSLAHAGF